MSFLLGTLHIQHCPRCNSISVTKDYDDELSCFICGWHEIPKVLLPYTEREPRASLQERRPYTKRPKPDMDALLLRVPALLEQRPQGVRRRDWLAEELDLSDKASRRLCGLYAIIEGGLIT